MIDDFTLFGLRAQLVIEAASVSVGLKLSMANSIILVTARAYEAVLWTQDEHFKDLEGVQYIEKKT
jgi:predicted nucleic acid-binding protein